MIDDAAVTDLIGQLSALDDRAYAEALADCVMDPEPHEQAAFRSEALAVRSLAGARYLIDNVNSAIRRRDGESNRAWQARAEHFRNRVGMERRLLDAIVVGIRARAGLLPNQPNPRGRAMRELARLHPVEFLALVRAEQERDHRRRQEERARRRHLRKSGQPANALSG